MIFFLLFFYFMENSGRRGTEIRKNKRHWPYFDVVFQLEMEDNDCIDVFQQQTGGSIL